MSEHARQDSGLGGPAPIGLFLLDRDLRFVSLNERLAEINGQPFEAHPGRHLGEVFPGDLVTLLEPSCRLVLESGARSETLEYTGPSAGGTPRHWLVTIRPAIPVPGFPAVLHVSVEDITLGDGYEFTGPVNFTGIDGTLAAGDPARHLDLRFLRKLRRWRRQPARRHLEQHRLRPVGLLSLQRPR